MFGSMHTSTSFDGYTTKRRIRRRHHEPDKLEESRAFQRTERIPISYCEQARDGEANSEIIGEIMRDLTCVVEKSYGKRVVDYQEKCASYEEELEELEIRLEEVEDSKMALADELMKAATDAQTAQDVYAEEARRRGILEGVVNEQKASINRLKAAIDTDGKERETLLQCVRELEERLREAQELIDALQAKVDDLEKDCHEHKEVQKKHRAEVAEVEDNCCSLEEALEKCCEENQEFQRQIKELQKQVETFKCVIEGLQNDRKNLINEFMKERECCDAEKARLNACILKLKDAIEAISHQKEEICRKMNGIVAQHHAEMDCLRRENARLKEADSRHREEIDRLKRALKDCAEDKRGLNSELQRLRRAVDSRAPETHRDRGNVTSMTSSRTYASYGMDMDCGEILRRMTSDWPGLRPCSEEIRRPNQPQRTQGGSRGFYQGSQRLGRGQRSDDEDSQGTQESIDDEDGLESREELKEIADELQIRNETLRKEVDEVQRDKVKVQEEVKLQETKVLYLTDQNTNLRGAISVLESQNSKFQAEIKDFRAREVAFGSSNDFRNLQQRLEASERSRDTLERQYHDLQAERNSLRCQIEELGRQKLPQNDPGEIVRLEITLRDLEERLQEVEDDNARLSRSLEKERTNKNLIQSELDKAHTFCEQEVKSRSALAQKIGRYQKLIESLQGQLSNSIKNDKVKGELEGLREKYKGLKADLKAEQDYVQKLKVKLVEYRERYKKLQEEFEKIQKPKEGQRSYHRLAHLLKKTKEDLGALNEEKYTLQRRNSELMESKKSLEDELNSNYVQKQVYEEVKGQNEGLVVEVETLKRLIGAPEVIPNYLNLITTGYEDGQVPEGDITDTEEELEFDPVQVTMVELLTSSEEVKTEGETKDDNGNEVIARSFDEEEVDRLRELAREVASDLQDDIQTLRAIGRDREEEFQGIRSDLEALKKRNLDACAEMTKVLYPNDQN